MFFGVFYNYNLFTILIIEFLLIDTYFLMSLINKMPKFLMTIKTKNNYFFNQVFVIYDSPKKYIMILDGNNKKTNLCKDSIDWMEVSN